MFELIIRGASTRHITHTKYSARKRSMFARKAHRSRLLFDGFVGDQNLPPGMASLMFSFFDCYTDVEYNVRRRLINLVRAENRYPIKVRAASLNCVHKLTYCASLRSTKKLITKYGV